MTTFERLNQLFRTVFEDDSIQLRADMTAGDVDGWDSFSHVYLVRKIEATFGFRFTEKELLKQRTVGDLIADIERKSATSG